MRGVKIHESYIYKKCTEECPTQEYRDSCTIILITTETRLKTLNTHNAPERIYIDNKNYQKKDKKPKPKHV